jgi:hypothetical protein
VQIEQFMVQAFQLRDLPRLDPVLVIVNQITSDRGQLIVECATEAWAAWFSNTGGVTVRELVMSITPESLADRLHNCHSRRTMRSDRVYEQRIAAAVIEAFKQLEGGGT